MGGGLESRCVVRVYGADGAVHGTIRTVHTRTITVHQVGILLYFMRKMHGETTLKPILKYETKISLHLFYQR